MIAFRFNLPGHDGARFLHGEERFLVVSWLFRLEGKAAFHDGCVQKDIDGIGDGYAEAGKDILGLGFHSGLDAHVDGSSFGHNTIPPLGHCNAKVKQMQDEF